MTFKLVKALGKLVVRLYQKEANLKQKESQALYKASHAAEEGAAALVTKSKELDVLAAKAEKDSTELSFKAYQLGKFFS